MMRSMGWLVGVVALLVLVTGCGGSGAVGSAVGGEPKGGEGAVAAAGGGEGAAPDAMRVEVAVVEATRAQRVLTLPGEVEGSRDARLAAALGGYVEAVLVHEGQAVRRGQALARIDATLHRAALAQAQARRDLAEAALHRLEALGEHASAADLDQARTELAVAEAAVEQARYRLARAVLTAPFDGIVARLDLEVGEVVAPGAPALRLVDIDPVVVALAVPDRDVVALDPGLPAEVTTAALGAAMQGRVARVGVAGDLRTRAFPVEVEVPNPEHLLRPGMIARVTVEVATGGEGVVIPQAWVVTRLDGQGVFVEEGGRARWRPLELGAVLHDQVQVTDGLEPGVRVVSAGQRDLVEGDPLLVERVGRCCEAGRVVYGEGA